ncbi:MAG: hypothetical protein AB7S36_10475 [Planctomycetota bacterium]
MIRIAAYPGDRRAFAVGSIVLLVLIMLEFAWPPVGAVLGVFVLPVWLWFAARSLLAVVIDRGAGIVHAPGRGSCSLDRVIGVRIESTLYAANVSGTTTAEYWSVSLLLEEPASDADRDDATFSARASLSDDGLTLAQPATPGEQDDRLAPLAPALDHAAFRLQADSRASTAIRSGHRLARELDLPLYDLASLRVEPAPSKAGGEQTRLHRIQQQSGAPGTGVGDEQVARVVGKDDPHAFELAGKGYFTTLGILLLLVFGGLAEAAFRAGEAGGVPIVGIVTSMVALTGLVLLIAGMAGGDARSLRIDRDGVHLLRHARTVKTIALADVLAVQMFRGGDFLAPRLLVISARDEIVMFASFLAGKRALRDLIHQRIRWFQVERAQSGAA